MAVHSFHVFDRKGKTLFTKRYATKDNNSEQDSDQLSEQRKLVFGMLFSLREMVSTLAPDSEIRDAGLHSVRTGAGTVHNYETLSGLRFALYTDNSKQGNGPAIRSSLKHIYTKLWVECVIRSPLHSASTDSVMNVSSTNFEPQLDAYLRSMTWFK
mmetsp:Transcript_3992/g.5748  ORF Transcript_3992/g.5748 Transcript_3992/m.5748 type:complete len:156 (+) Transcript_3992:123-590(+)